MNKNKFFFYIPSGESLSLLYFLSQTHRENLVVVSNSVSIIEICKFMNINFTVPNFSKVTTTLNKKYYSISFFKVINNYVLTKLLFRLLDFFINLINLLKAKKFVNNIPANSTFYFSTFFYDIPGLLLLYSSINNSQVNTLLIKPRNYMKFGLTEKPKIVSSTFFLNIFTRNFFVFHLDPVFGRVVGANPSYFIEKNIFFSFKNRKINGVVDEKYIKKAIYRLHLKESKKRKILFLGEYSVENGEAIYGKVYLDVLKVLANSRKFDIYFKPHPQYHSINHPALTGLHILDSQLPVEFFDNGSWAFIISFATASILTKKKSKCINLLKLQEIECKTFDLDRFTSLLSASPNHLIYPVNLKSFNKLLTNHAN